MIVKPACTTLNYGLSRVGPTLDQVAQAIDVFGRRALATSHANERAIYDTPKTQVRITDLKSPNCTTKAKMHCLRARGAGTPYVGKPAAGKLVLERVEPRG